MSRPIHTTVVFDLGGVLVDWNPRYLYRKLFNGDEATMENFLATVCTHEWNLKQDAGRRFEEGCAELAAKHPNKAELIYAWYHRFDETFSGPIQETVDILAELKERQTPVYALTNWNKETFEMVRNLFPFFEWFNGIVISGVEKIVKPDERIYRILMSRYSIDPRKAVYIDDSDDNVKTAQRLGFTGIHYTTPEDLRKRLQRLNLIARHPVSTFGSTAPDRTHP